MRYVYILRSINDEKRHYTGVTSDLRARLEKRNRGEVSHTSKFRPWRLQTYIGFADDKRAYAFEQYLKSGSGRAFAKKTFVKGSGLPSRSTKCEGWCCWTLAQNMLSLRMRLFPALLLFITPAFAWQAVPHEEGTAQRIEGEKISGAAETGDNVYILIEPKQVLPQLEPGPEIAYRNIILNYGDSYICGPLREIKITVDGALVRETDPIEGTLHDWHIFNKGFLTTHYGEVLSFESMAQADGSDLATRLLNAKETIVFERKIDNCGDDGVFVFGVSR